MKLLYIYLSYDVASGSEILPCNKIHIPLVVYRFTGIVMTSITTLLLNPIMVYSYGFLFNCTTVGQASDSMTALT